MVDEKSIDAEAPDTEPAKDVVEAKTEKAENAVETPEALEPDTSGDNVEVKDEKPKAKRSPAKKPKAEKPKADVAPAKKPKAEKPKADVAPAKKPKAEKPKADAAPVKKPKVEKSKGDAAPAKKPKAEKPKADAAPAKKPKVEKPKADAAPAKKPKVEKPKADGAPAKKPKAEKPKVDAPSVETPAVETSVVEEHKEEESPAEVVPEEPERTFADELREEYGDIETAKLDILPDLERKRDRLNALAEEHKSKRDRMNSITKQLAEERDRYNGQVRELVANANENRNNRNLLNNEVKESKVLRDDLNKKATEFNEIVQALKRERMTETGGPSLNRLRNELKSLEFKAMTSVMTVDKEKELIGAIQRLQAQIEDQERKMEENREVRTALRDSRQAKEEAEAQHRMVSDLARRAQTAHDSMIELYETADELRKKADDCQARFIANKQLADAEHKSHIDLIRKVHDYDKFISGLRRRERRARKDRQEKAQKKVAEDMMDRFKKGEKISTEDLLSLQTERY